MHCVEVLGLSIKPGEVLEPEAELPDVGVGLALLSDVVDQGNIQLVEKICTTNGDEDGDSKRVHFKHL